MTDKRLGLSPSLGGSGAGGDGGVSVGGSLPSSSAGNIMP